MYKPQTPSYTPYYEGVKAQTTPTSVTASQPIPAAAATGTTTYVPTYSLTTTADSGGSVIGYPSYSQSSYASAANAYYKQMKENKTSSTGQVRLPMSRPVAPGSVNHLGATSTDILLRYVRGWLIYLYLCRLSAISHRGIMPPLPAQPLLI